MPSQSLKRQTVSGMLWSSVQRFGSMGVSFIANLVLARLLLPEDFGSIGILMVFITFSGIFVDSGFGAALIQKKNPTIDDYSTIFYLNLIISFILYLLLYFSAPIISDFYKIPSLSLLLRVLSLILFFNSFSLIQDNQLRKQLNFKKLSIISLSSSILGAIFGITSAYLGFGVWSLVINSLVGAFAKTILLWILAKWHPILVFSKKSLKELFSFGGFILANSLLYTFRNNIQALIIGKLFSARDLGFYTQAKKLQEVPTTSFSSIVDQVSFPLFSKLQEDKVNLKKIQRTSLQSLAFVSFPLLLLLIVIASSLITFLFTNKWAESVPYFQILCVGGLAMCLQAVNANVVNALGKSALYFKWSIVKTFFLFLSIWIGSFYGMKGLLYGSILGSWFDYFINAGLSSKLTGYKVIEQLKDLFPILIISSSIGVLTWFVGEYINIHYLYVMMIQVLIFTISYLLISYIFKIETCISFFTMIKNKIK